MTKYTEKHRQYYLKNIEKILEQRRLYEPKWISTDKGKYSAQKRKAKQRGIDWQFTFETWKKVWDNSGHWNERGDCAGKYCMARLGDVGPYSEDNVVIKLVESNCFENYSLQHKDTLGIIRGKL